MKHLITILLTIALSLPVLSFADQRETKTTIVITSPEKENDGDLALSNSTRLVSDEEAVMYLGSSISSYDAQSMWADFTYLEKKTEIRTIHLYINSGGGQVFAGLGLADLLESVEKKGFKIIAHATGLVASATVPILAVCSERIASPGTLFMVHQVSIFKFMASENSDDIRAQNELLDLMKERYLTKLAAYTKVSKEEWHRMEQRTTWFDAQKALEFGLIDRIE